MKRRHAAGLWKCKHDEGCIGCYKWLSGPYTEPKTLSKPSLHCAPGSPLINKHWQMRKLCTHDRGHGSEILLIHYSERHEENPGWRSSMKTETTLKWSVFIKCQLKQWRKYLKSVRNMFIKHNYSEYWCINRGSRSEIASMFNNLTPFLPIFLLRF